MRRKYLFLLIIITALSALSCSQSIEGTGDLSLFVLRADENTKALTTDNVYTVAMDVASYEYKAVCTSNPGAHGTQNSWAPISVSGNSSTISGMSRGYWTVSMRAKNSNGGVILQGEVSLLLGSSSKRHSITLTNRVTDYSIPIPTAVTVSVGVTVPSIENTNVVMRYTPLSEIGNMNNSGTGGNPVSVSSVENHRTTISGSSISLITPSPGHTAAYGAVSLTPGLYVFQILFKQGSTVLSGQTISIYVGELSPFAINGTLTSGEFISFTATPSVILTHNNLNPFFSQMPEMSADGHITASVSVPETLTDPVYEWYVNGILDSGQTGEHYTSTNTYHFGIHAVSCVVSGVLNGRRAMGFIGEDIETRPLSNVGGTIFYVDNSATGTYEFYNASGVRVMEPTAGTDCTGWSYRQVSEGNGKDKFYVYNENAIIKSGGSGSYNSPYVAWTYMDENNHSYNNYNSSAGYRGRVYDSTVNTALAVGTGKANTQNVMSIVRNVRLGGVVTNTNAYIQGRWIRWRGQSTYSETIWYVCDEFNKGTYWRFDNTTGCDDWFIPSIEELRQFRNHFTSTAAFLEKTSLNNRYAVVWSSSAFNSSNYAYCWVASLQNNNYSYRAAEYRDYGNGNMALVLVRAF